MVFTWNHNFMFLPFPLAEAQMPKSKQRPTSKATNTRCFRAPKGWKEKESKHFSEPKTASPSLTLRLRKKNGTKTFFWSWRSCKPLNIKGGNYTFTCQHCCMHINFLESIEPRKKAGTRTDELLNVCDYQASSMTCVRWLKWNAFYLTF